MTPKDRQSLETIKTMLIFCVNSINEHEKRDMMKIEDFQPDLEKVPKLCLEEESAMAERTLKALQKELSKKDVLAMSDPEKIAGAKRMASIVDFTWTKSRKKEE